MFLIYTDESGKDFKKDKSGIFRDGPCFLYGGLAIKVEKHNAIENAFKLMCKEILGVENIYKNEIHAGDIFYSKKDFKDTTFGTKRDFFKEVLQLLAKLNVPLVLGIVHKDSSIFSSNLEKEASAVYSFFSALDSFLLEKEDYGVIIADEFGNDIKNIKDLLDEKKLVGKNGGVKLSFLLRRIYFEKLQRFKEYDFKPLLPLRYKFESQIYAILDNIHYVNSKFSVFNQLADIVLFLFNIFLEVQEYKNIHPEKVKLAGEIEKDLKYFLDRTKSEVTFLVCMEDNFDITFIENLDKEISELTIALKAIQSRKMQASGT